MLAYQVGLTEDDEVIACQQVVRAGSHRATSPLRFNIPASGDGWNIYRFHYVWGNTPEEAIVVAKTHNLRLKLLGDWKDGTDRFMNSPGNVYTLVNSITNQTREDPAFASS